jgi:hypothetical protein
MKNFVFFNLNILFLKIIFSIRTLPFQNIKKEQIKSKYSDLHVQLFNEVQLPLFEQTS